MENAIAGDWFVFLQPLFVGSIAIFSCQSRVKNSVPERVKQKLWHQKPTLLIIRLSTPWYPVASDIPMAKMFHHGDLDFNGLQKDPILQIIKAVPTIVDIYLDRPAVIPDY